MRCCTGRFGRWSEPRMTCVIPRSRSSATEASWYVAVPSGRSSVVPFEPNRTEPSSSRRAAPDASALSAARRYTAPRSLCRSGPSSKSTPSHARSSRIASSPPSTLRAGSVSSIRRTSTPSRPSAKRRFATAVSAFPRWSEPVGLGAKRTRTVTVYASIGTWPGCAATLSSQPRIAGYGSRSNPPSCATCVYA